MILSMVPTVPGASLSHLDHVNTAAALPLQPGGYPSTSIHMPPTKRPKLSLQTSQLPSAYASSASNAGKSVDKMATTTPTTLNTFTNTFDLSIRPSPTSATASPSSLHLRTRPTASPLRRTQPYNLPFGVKSILKNSRITKDYRRGSLTASASPCTGRKVFFPPTKKVSFQAIDEEIVTHTYTARHVDLSSSEDDELSSTSDTEKPSDVDKPVTVRETTPLPQLPSTTPQTLRSPSPILQPRLLSHSPSTLRIKRKRRRWEWTLNELKDGEVVIQPTFRKPHTTTSEITRVLDSLDDSVRLKATTAAQPVLTTSVSGSSDENDVDDDSKPEQESDDIHLLASSTPLPSSPTTGESRQSRVKALIRMFQEERG